MLCSHCEKGQVACRYLKTGDLGTTEEDIRVEGMQSPKLLSQCGFRTSRQLGMLLGGDETRVMDPEVLVVSLGIFQPCTRVH